MSTNKFITEDEKGTLLTSLKKRFEGNMHRHPELSWSEIAAKLETKPDKLWSLYQMELTEGEPDVIGFDAASQRYLFVDCAPESPKGRRSVCYDSEALASRKEHKPKHSAAGMASEMGVDLLDEAGYRALQALGKFDAKTSSWISTPPDIRAAGGAIFADWRYGHVFIYHNGAESYYAARGFRAALKV